MSDKILVIEDEGNLREILGMLLEGEGYAVTTAADGLEGLEKLAGGIFDLVITDIKMPGADGLQILAKAKKISPAPMVLMITAFGTVESAIEAMKAGAYDYIHKPFKIDEIRLIVRNALEKRHLHAEVSMLRKEIKTAYRVENLIGKSPVMQETLSLIHKVAGSGSSVFITGESGTGKELVARAIHNLSPMADMNFVAINCATFPEGLLESELFGHMRGSFTGAVQNKQGLFEVADGGTLFLDEVADMPVGLQSKLLRTVEDGTLRRVGGTADIKVNVRVIAATNRNIKEAVEGGSFREDLYYRLNVIPLHVPPLRERKEDIPLLIGHFLKKFSAGKRQFAGSALKLLMEHEWRGNVRELENMVERVLLLADNETITEVDLPEEVRGHAVPAEGRPQPIEDGIDLEETIAGMEKRYLLEALRLADGKKTAAAKLLGLSFRAFRHRLSKYGIK